MSTTDASYVNMKSIETNSKSPLTALLLDNVNTWGLDFVFFL